VDRRLLLKALTAYLIFVVYGSLIPFEYHYLPMAEALQSFRHIRLLDLGVTSRADLLANFVLYVPLGFLGVGCLTAGVAGRLRRSIVAVLVLVACSALAIAIEFTQLYFAPRTVSLNDISAEILGTAFGVGMWLTTSAAATSALQAVREGGRTAMRAMLVLYVLAYYALALFPYDFLLSAAEFHWKSVGNNVGWIQAINACSSTANCAGVLMAETAFVVPIGLMLNLVMRTETRTRFGITLATGILLGVSIELLQFAIASGVSQGISVLTRILGVLLGLLVYGLTGLSWLWAIQRHWLLRPMVVAATATYLSLTAWLVWEGHGDWIGLDYGLDRINEINFLPFYYHYYTSEPVALANLLYNSALYLPYGLMVWLWYLPQLRLNSGLKRVPAVILGGLAAVVIETGKLFLSATHPDPTNVLIGMVSAWTGYLVTDWIFRSFSQLLGTPEPTAMSPPRNNRVVAGGNRRPTNFKRPVIITSTLLFFIVAASAAYQGRRPREVAADESTMPTFLAPAQLPAADLPNFRFAHPRLPIPSSEDIETLRRENPNFINAQRRRAQEGQGDPFASIFIAYLEPHQSYLDGIFKQVTEAQFANRGHQEVKPLAMAYDWLYDQWNEDQRRQLRSKLVEGCNFVIDLIRKDRLSPYNVYLYNSPFQALMACSIAVYGDDTRGDPVMAFTYDYWKNRVLPVWRQVMGQYGGWHEGNEYLGIGIGQAIYELPAMWRRATGEDYFKTEPGIRGFLDFLVYRLRPDGSNFRWGDGGWYNRKVPDRLALALEYGDSAAYSLGNPPRPFRPTSWPWGPLTNNHLLDPDAIKKMPLSAYFDGLGLVVARSDWSPDATYVTFKAGDNYWSHVHLDQGAFTIYKGGALAIDSGLYGPRYDSDHHMNYSYQTIAHNTITVTDPADTVPAPAPPGREPRQIANDGGQRRIGSGWGVEPAPLDLGEWQAKREIYHTGEIRRLLQKDGLTVAVADVTPAYTNSLSGKGTFSHRTRRVDDFQRIFGYDSIDDVIVIYDQVTATRADFTKRWLLHTIQKPRVTPGGFVVNIDPSASPGHRGGRLEAHVLLPKHSIIQSIGGKGLEFFVDNHNYDEGVAATSRRRKDSETGQWRIEVSPRSDEKADEFLVVLFPSLENHITHNTVKSRTVPSGVVVEITGTRRTTRWRFTAGEEPLKIDVVEGTTIRSYAISRHDNQIRSE